MNTINVLGQPCPIPVIKAKKELQINNSARLLVDNFVAVQNLEKMAKGLNYSISYNSIDNYYEVIISHEGMTDENVAVQATENGMKHNYVVVIAGDSMGQDIELGKILIKGFIFSLTELPILPSHVVFLNSGAKLNTVSSNTAKDIKTLDEKGVKIFTCGTCANYYNIQDKLVAGEIVDMYKISLLVSEAVKLITI